MEKTSFASVLLGLLPFARHYLIREATERELDARNHMRWGPDEKAIAACSIATVSASSAQGRLPSRPATPAISAKAAGRC
jgi:hypothetical protein